MMTLKLIVMFASLCFLSPIYGQEKLAGHPNIRMCVGTEDPEEVNSASSSHSYKYVTTTYSNCTHIVGSVVLNNLAGDVDLSFLNSIVEIGGSLIIINNHNVSRISFQNLSVIRGHVPYIISLHNVKTKKALSLYISHNKMVNGKPGVIHLGSLTSVIQHDISVVNNTGYCHLQSVDWKLFPEKESQTVRTYFPPCDAKPKCASTCLAINGQQFCYGSLPTMCQLVPNCDRSICGTGRCYRDAEGIQRCCRDECAGGCLNTRSDCFACKNFKMGTQCVPNCPPKYKINSSVNKNIPNPNFLFTLGSLCVKKCPAKFLEDGSSCVTGCTPRKTYFSEDRTKCLPCSPNVPSCGVCHQSMLDEALWKKKRNLFPEGIHYDNKKDKFTLTMRSVMKALINCTTFDGDITINLLSSRPILGKDKVDLQEHIRAEDFDNLKNLEHLNGQLYLILKFYPTIKNLKFLSKLKSISSTSGSGFLVFGNPNFEYLGLNSLKKIEVNKAQVVHAPKLCYMENFKKRFGTAKVSTTKLKDEKLCEKEGKVCDKNCSPKGCWGPGRFMCFECRQQTAGNECVAKCENAAGFYTVAGNSTCGKCHVQCKKTCSGPRADQCVGGCKFAQNGTTCVANCSVTQYLDAKGLCQACAKVCYAGMSAATLDRRTKSVCSGPEDRRSLTGCRRCETVKLDRSGKQLKCMAYCPKKGFFERLLNKRDLEKNPGQLTSADVNSRTMTCNPCHPFCLTCYHGIHEACKRCKPAYYKKDPSTCDNKCVGDFYKSDTGVRRCLPCDKTCRNGCSGPFATDCVSCEKYRNYLDNNNKNWTCVMTCPPGKNFTYPDPETGDNTCVVALPGSGKRLTVGLSVGLFVFVAIIVAVIVFVCVQRRRAKLLRDRDLLRARYTRQIQDEMPDIHKTDFEPNAGQLRMIGNKHLTKGVEIGSGAFGTVYKGVWRPPKEKDDEVEIAIDVAIKELKESGNLTTTKEFLDEAHVMASVEHHFCIQLLGVCLTSHMQLITEFMPLGCLKDYLPKHVMELGSQQLLTWVVQIAKGMAYLESRGIVHRDLAARNVLLQNKDQIRITDFGLAKLLDPSGDEFQADAGRFPIRWLALECLGERVFSSKSDVWSFGVTCWEIFTFGKQRPYQDVPAAKLYDFLDTGERLQQPDICTLDIYMVMIKCWLVDPESRPLFSELVPELSAMASDPGRYLIIKHDKMAHHLSDRNSSYEGSTSPRVSSIFAPDDKPLKPFSVALPDPSLPHLAAEISGKATAPSVPEHYSEDPVHLSSPPPIPPAPPVPLACLDEEVDVETGDFAVEDDYLLPDANDDDYVAPSQRPPARPSSKAPPEHEYTNQPMMRNRDVHNPRYMSEVEPVMDDDYMAPDPMNDTRESAYSDMDGAAGGYLDPLISRSSGHPSQQHPRA